MEQIKGTSFERTIQIKYLRPLRLKAIIKIIKGLPGGTVLDMGCMDDYILKRLPSQFDYYGIDDDPLCSHPRIEKKKVEELEKGKKYDIVVLTEVLEHLEDPVAGMRLLKDLTKRYILISVPNEPFFGFFRGFIPAREHRWTIFPSAFRAQFGEPIFETTACFKRTYIALWDLGEDYAKNAEK